jgi:hypothetical protein
MIDATRDCSHPGNGRIRDEQTDCLKARMQKLDALLQLATGISIRAESRGLIRARPKSLNRKLSVRFAKPSG